VHEADLRREPLVTALVAAEVVPGHPTPPSPATSTFGRKACVAGRATAIGALRVHPPSPDRESRMREARSEAISFQTT